MKVKNGIKIAGVISLALFTLIFASAISADSGRYASAEAVWPKSVDYRGLQAEVRDTEQLQRKVEATLLAVDSLKRELRRGDQSFSFTIDTSPEIYEAINLSCHNVLAPDFCDGFCALIQGTCGGCRGNESGGCNCRC